MLLMDCILAILRYIVLKVLLMYIYLHESYLLLYQGTDALIDYITRIKLCDKDEIDSKLLPNKVQLQHYVYYIILLRRLVLTRLVD